MVHAVFDDGLAATLVVLWPCLAWIHGKNGCPFVRSTQLQARCTAKYISRPSQRLLRVGSSRIEVSMQPVVAGGGDEFKMRTLLG